MQVTARSNRPRAGVPTPRTSRGCEANREISGKRLIGQPRFEPRCHATGLAFLDFERIAVSASPNEIRVYLYIHTYVRVCGCVPVSLTWTAGVLEQVARDKRLLTTQDCRRVRTSRKWAQAKLWWLVARSPRRECLRSWRHPYACCVLCPALGDGCMCYQAARDPASAGATLP